MSYVNQFNTLLEDATASFQAAVDKAAKEQDKKFQAIISSFIDNLNVRYKRHLFLFCDSMGSKSVEMYHRVTGERLCWWSCEQGRFDERCPKVVIKSLSRDLSGTGLDDEINDFMEALSLFESQLCVGQNEVCINNERR